MKESKELGVSDVLQAINYTKQSWKPVIDRLQQDFYDSCSEGQGCFSVDKWEQILTEDNELFKGKSSNLRSVYLFWVRLPGEYDHEKFVRAWDDRKFDDNRLKTIDNKQEAFPKTNKLNLNYWFAQPGEWRLFYLGKSEKDIKGRISQHVGIGSPTTSSLKLGLSKKDFKDWQFKLQTISFGKDCPSYGLAMIEALLHERMRPMVGAV